ncbi:MAG: DNA repair protein RecN [Actinomycetes bacterium]|nr:DNA repair protein RecN [Actinomycetes bacterium]
MILETLHVRDLALIDEAWLELGPGLTALTGETGAGKTVLLSALALLLGERADSSLVRAGADAARVEAQFSDGMVAARRISADGRGRATLNGEMTTVGALAQATGPLIDLHGQHDHQALMRPAAHIEYLDRWAGAAVSTLLAVYRDARLTWQAAAQAVADIQAARDRDAEDLEMGRLALAEIERIDPLPGEDDDLRARLPMLEHAEELAEHTRTALDALRTEGGVLELLYTADAALERASGMDEALGELRERMAEARGDLEGLADALADYHTHIEHDPQALTAAFERLAELEGLCKRFGPTLNAVLERRDSLLRTADMTENVEERLAQARAAEQQARDELTDAAAGLTAARRAAADSFIAALTDAAADLQLGQVTFTVDIAARPFDAWTADGADKVEILYAPSPQTPARPLAKIASGGEISRVMLALKSVFGQADGRPILVFDEIDAGIGGAVATAVGAKLKQLAQTHQVIVVTHLAQVAVYADAQLRVSKQAGDATRTIVEPVTGAARTAEIARMLSGSTDTVACAHATELLRNATT